VPPVANLLGFALAALVLVAIPGPSVLFVLGRSLALGRWGGLLSVVGNALGMVPQVAAVSLGVGIVVAQSAILFTVLKVAGAAYLIHLGIQAIRHRGRATAMPGLPERPSAARLLREGFLVGATNPKSIVFFVAVLPQFADVRAGAIPLQLAVLGAVFLGIALACDSVWALAAGWARDWFARSPRRLSRMSAVGGGLMIGLGATLVATGSKA